MTSMLELALRYAQQGIPVAPMQRADKRPHYSASLDYKHGIKDATTEPGSIVAWWRFWKDAMIGLAMGEPSGLFALDVDVKGEVDGWDTLAQLGIVVPPGTPRIRTPTGGCHLIFRQPPFKISNSAGKLGPGLDIRTTGGYIIAAGSIAATDIAYELVVGDEYGEAPEAPPKLLELLKEKPRASARDSSDAGPSTAWGEAALRGEVEAVAKAPKGTRNNQLNASAFRIGGVVAGGHLDAATAKARLLGAAFDLIKDKGIAAAEKTFESGFNAGLREPRHPEAKANGHDTGENPQAPWDPDNVPYQSAPIEAPPLLTSAEFMADMRPPEWLVDGLLTRGFSYTLTGRTGTGKTLMAIKLAFDTVMGHGFSGRENEPGAVAFFAGENADNVRVQWYAHCKHHGVDPASLRVFWFDTRFAIGKALDDIARKLDPIEDLLLVVFDSLQAFFFGDDENTNTQMLTAAVEHRQVVKRHKNRPTGITLAHPVKNASKDNLLPRGGSSVTNELDGNLTLWRDEETEIIELHWQGKWRGPPFEAETYEELLVEPEGLVSAKGKQMAIKILKPISAAAIAEKRERLLSEDEMALLAIQGNGKITNEELARILGKSSRTSGQRTKDRLVRNGLIKRKGDGYELTKSGKATLDS